MGPPGLDSMIAVSWSELTFLFFSKTMRLIIGAERAATCFFVAACACSTNGDATRAPNNDGTATAARATPSFNLYTADAIGSLSHSLYQTKYDRQRPQRWVRIGL